MDKNYQIPRVEDYQPLSSLETAGRILTKAGKLKRFHIANINFIYYGGSVAKLLSSSTFFWFGNLASDDFKVAEICELFLSHCKELKNKRLHACVGRVAKESVRQKFLMLRYIEAHLDLLQSFSKIFAAFCLTTGLMPRQKNASAYE